LRLLFQYSCREAIQAVAQPGYHEQAEGRLVVGLKNRNDQKGYEAQAQERKQVGSCAQFFQQGVPIFVAATRNLDGT
jgi:hypothetical protein